MSNKPKKDFKSLSERQRNILKFMKRYMDRTGYPPTIREIGEATDINSTSVVNYNLNKLVDAGYLQRSDKVSRGLRLVADIPGMRKKKVTPTGDVMQVPLMGTIVASEPVPVPEDAYEEDLIDVPPSLLHNFDPSEVFALRVRGDSMMDAMIQENDVVILSRQETASDGEMVAVWLTDRSETTLKYFYNEGERVRLQPAHPTMEPIYVDPQICQIRGRVLSVIRTI